MEHELDTNGQPDEAFNWNRRLDRGMDELLGLSRGVLADGALVVEEARFMLDWLKRNEPVRRDFLGKKLFAALTAVLGDDQMDSAEEDVLVDLLLRFTGGTPIGLPDSSYSTSLPLDEPPPDVRVPGYSFCFTGKFTFGPRRACESCISCAGGVLHKYPIFATSYLVVGEIGSRDWIHSSSGRKIERAIQIREQGHPLKLISEAHWCECIGA